MKFSVAATTLFLILPCFAQQDSAVVRFSNGDQLSGNIRDLSKEMLTWDSKILKEPAEFDLKHVLDLTTPGTHTETNEPTPGHEATLVLTNGDTARGQLIALSDSEIGLQTAFGGEMVFRRVNVKDVQISGGSDYFYRGPNSMEEWTTSLDADAWTFKKNALYATAPGGIAREIDFPEESSISFDASWRGSFLPRIIFYSNDITTISPQKGYELMFQGNSVQLRKCGTNGMLGHSTNSGRLRENEKAHIEIRSSRRTGKIAIFIDGDFIELWEDNELDKDDLGNGFHIVSQNSTPLRINNIAVTEWDGYTDDLPNRQERFQGRNFRAEWDLSDEGIGKSDEETDNQEGRMVLKNGDTIEGEVIGIKGDLISLKTAFTEVTFPLQRLKNLVLKKADLETPKLYAGDVRATLVDGSQLVFRLDGVEQDSLIGFSQNFGTVRFKRDAFSKIEFNIYDRTLDAQRLVVDW